MLLLLCGKSDSRCLFLGYGYEIHCYAREIADRDGPTIADTFYEELFRGPDGKPGLEPDTRKSARALHVAVQKLRSQNASFARWVPFIHMGK